MAKVQPLSVESLDAELRAFEAQYRTPSDDLVSAFRNSPLRETDDFRRWSLLYAARNEVSKRKPR